jgi:hypothetical protein
MIAICHNSTAAQRYLNVSAAAFLAIGGLEA